MDDFNYEKMVAKSLIYVVKQALETTATKGLPGDHFFNITFMTSHPDCDMPEKLKNQYPGEMTIVLQYEFSALTVTDEGFSVVLNFSGVPSKLYIPFAAIKFFVDPSANFGLQFEPEMPPKRPLFSLKPKHSGNIAPVPTAFKGKEGKEKGKEQCNKSATIIDFSSLKKGKK